MRSHVPHSGFLLLTALAKPATMPKQLMRITVSGVMRSHVHCTPQAWRQQPPQPTGPQSNRDPACNLGHKAGSTHNRDINRTGPVASP